MKDIIWAITYGQYVMNDYQTKFIEECIYRQFISERIQYMKYVIYYIAHMIWTSKGLFRILFLSSYQVPHMIANSGGPNMTANFFEIYWEMKATCLRNVFRVRGNNLFPLLASFHSYFPNTVCPMELPAV